jgi:hypothetical protein
MHSISAARVRKNCAQELVQFYHMISMVDTTSRAQLLYITTVCTVLEYCTYIRMTYIRSVHRTYVRTYVGCSTESTCGTKATYVEGVPNDYD